MDMKMVRSSEVIKVFINDKEFVRVKNKSEPKSIDLLVS
jgi:hypothetical protein